LSEDLRLFAKPEKIKYLCPVIKVGYVLQELGVLPIREEEYELGVDKRLKDISPSLLIPLKHYIALMRNKRRSEKTVLIILHKIKKFHDWLHARHKMELWLASETTARQYLTQFAGDVLTLESQLLGRFYKWAKYERYTTLNPFENIKTGKTRRTLKICSPEHVKKIEKYIKSSKSTPESAMILALILYFGVKSKELTYATVEFEGQRIKIIFYRGQLTFGNRRYGKDQVFTLPQGPKWFLELQKRFLQNWHERFKKIRSDIPRQPLILHPRGLHNRPLTTNYVVYKIYYPIIIGAVGIRIPPHILRRTGAALYTSKSGSGVLEEMGWSKGHAFKFTWMPRQFIGQVPNKN
jgi:site-specific recombinase XerD